jgi:adenylate cyclase
MDPTHSPDAIDGLIAQLVALGLCADALPPLVGALASGLRNAGVPLQRVQLAMPARHALFDAQTVTWRHGAGMVLRSFAHGGRDQEPFRSSPIAYMMDTGTTTLHCRLDGDAALPFPVLHDLREGGATDYYARLVGFGAGAPMLRGVNVSFASAAPEGFAAGALAAIERALPAFALACYRVQQLLGTLALARSYLGGDAAARVLSGGTRRGDVVAIDAALLIADLRGFTALADSMAGEPLVATLNDYLEPIGVAVEDHGGQILKFLGDGMLAIFAIAAPDDGAAVCARALAAAQAALAAVEALNAGRRATGAPLLALDVALHVGRVMYGNIGARERLDFTVIGPAVNEVARLEPLCATLGTPLLMSGAFAARCGGTLRSLGAHAMRGVAAPQELFTLA